VWLRREAALCIAYLPDSPLLNRLRELYDSRRAEGRPPSFSRAELTDALAGSASAADQGIAAAVDRLIERGVLTPYLIEDLAAPAVDLTGLDSASEALVACVGRWQLARVDVDALPGLEQELSAAVAGSKDAHASVRYYVNSYAGDDLQEAEKAAAEVVGALAELKPLLTVEGNFACQQRVMRTFFEEQLPEGTTRPYLELLTIFLRHRVQILDRLRWGQEARAYHAVARKAAALQGQLDQTDLHRLLALLESRPESEVCCVGPFDFAKRQFFLTNVFAGGRVSVARYLLARRCDAPSEEPDDATLDVELAVTSEHSLNFVVRRFDAGFGFESRWAHGYRRWVEPHEVVVGRQHGQPVYVHAPTGRVLRFHYRGLLQAQYLPIEYQLLLLGHAANYHSPFAVSMSVDPGEEVVKRPGLLFGPVCVRREQWWVSAPTLFGLLGTEPAAATIRLREWVHERLAEEELWYYRLPQSGRRGEKPRLLDLRSPLSIMSFRQILGARPSHVLLSRMEPGRVGLWQAEGESYVAELMVEA
jgi:hypothetical protein